MNGLKYLLFVKEMPLKEVAKHLGVTPQLIASWSNGAQNIPDRQLSALSDFFKVEEMLIRKELSLNDKIMIERQLESTRSTTDLNEISALYVELKSLQQRLKETEQRVGSYQLQNQQLRKQLSEVQAVLNQR